MITAYATNDRSVTVHELARGAPLPPGTVWLDLTFCDDADIAYIDQVARVHLPRLQSLRVLEQSRQHYRDKSDLYLILPMIVGGQSDAPHSGVMAAALTPQLLITVRQADSRAVSAFAEQVRKKPALIGSSAGALMGLLESVIDRLTDLTEVTSHDLEQVSRLVFRDSLNTAKGKQTGPNESWRKVLQGLGRTAGLVHRLRDTLTGLGRIVSFLSQPALETIDEASRARLQVMQRDIAGLVQHVDYHVNESTFLLDAIVGAISIEQNNVFKIFSMVTVTLMPPTLIAGIFGMNFNFMPELEWKWGYYAALAAMLAAAILPWLWFKRKGWF